MASRENEGLEALLQILSRKLIEFEIGTGILYQDSNFKMNQIYDL